jgi:peroxin-19
MKAQFENMLKELGGAGLGEDLEPAPAGAKGQLPSSSTKSAAPAVGEESFQETIKKTMERMQASGDKATAAAAEDDSDDILAELMKQMGAGALDGEGGEEDFSKMLLGMMEQLTNKDILYEPMKELDDKFPDWMEKNREKTPAADLKRYEEQRTVVREIVAKFEEKTYKDENVADREYIVERMQKVRRARHVYCSMTMLTMIRCKQQVHLRRILLVT